MNSNKIIEIKYIAETDQFLINGELWNKEEPPLGIAKKQYYPKPECGERYYYINDTGEITLSTWWNDTLDTYRYDTLNCWLDKSEAEAYIARYGNRLPSKLQLAIRRWKIAKGVEDRFDWGNENQGKWCIFYNHLAQKWLFRRMYTFRQPNTEYFHDLETAERCLSDLRPYFDDQVVEWEAEKILREAKRGIEV